MPESEQLQDHRPEILKELDDFNTAPEFGMLGILQEQEQQMHDAERGKALLKAENEREAPELPESRPAVKEQDLEKYYAPLNSTIQEQGYRHENRLANIERALGNLSNTQQQARQEVAPQSILPSNYDPEAPLMMGHLGALDQRLQQLDRLNQETSQRSTQAQLRGEYLRAHLELERYRRTHPDFAVSPQELDTAWNGVIGNDLTRATNANWTAHFDQIYNNVVGPKRDKELTELRKEVEELRKQMKEGPKPQRKPENISPSLKAVARTSNAISSPLNEGGEDDQILGLASYKKKGNFSSFVKDYKRLRGFSNTG